MGKKSSQTITGGGEQVVLKTVEEQVLVPGGTKLITEEQPIAESEVIPKGYRIRPNVDKIPCPFLAAAYNNGDLTPEPDGTLNTKDLDDALAGVGISHGVRAILVVGADKTDEILESLNLFKLRDSILDHSGSTGIRDPKVNPQKLDELLSFGEGGKMFEKHFAVAANEFARRDPGFVGTVTETTEFTAILQVFGRIDGNGNRYLTNSDIKGLWLDGRYPQDWKPRPPDSIGLGTLAARSGLMGLKRIFSAIGAFFKKNNNEQ